jgi:hypothetical protein
MDDIDRLIAELHASGGAPGSAAVRDAAARTRLRISDAGK